MKSPVWGLPDLIPDDAPAYFGCRAILRQGFPEVLGDRKDFQIDSDDGQAFMEWFEGPGWDWIEKESSRCYGNEDKLHSYDDGRFHVRMNTNASYGYLYITAWMDAGSSN